MVREAAKKSSSLMPNPHPLELNGRRNVGTMEKKVPKKFFP